MVDPMTTAVNLVDKFTELFGKQPNGCDANEVVHCRASPIIVDLCREAMTRTSAELFEHFEAWDKS